MAKKIGSQTILLDRKVYIRERACIVGEKEKNGPLGEFFDQYEEAYFGEDTWEKAESKFLSSTYDKLLTKLNLNDDAVDCILGGDLINQCMSSAFGLKKTYRPYLGLFGACSTMAESILVGSLFIDGGGFDNVACITSSHFCAAEKQFRAPLELGVQRAPTSQWTVTGSGAVLLSWEEGTAAKVTEGTSEIVYGKKSKPFITAVTPGKILDYNVTDANNMGAAMAPAAASTIMAHLSDTGRSPDYYDLIITGDLGIIGGELCKDIMENHGYLMHDKLYSDCGMKIFDPNTQGTFAGGSGCACSAVVLTGYLLDQMEKGVYGKILFVATGALMNPISIKQGVPILGVAHAVAIENKMTEENK